MTSLSPPPLRRLRRSAAALCLAVLGWSAGCASTRPMVEPAFASRAYTPARISVLPPAVFAVYDEYGDNDPQKSAALGRSVAEETARVLAEALRAKGYAVDASARWDGVYSPQGQLILPGNELAWFANSVLQFANSEAGGGEGPMAQPALINPQLAARLGWATQSDALLYVNMKGVAISPGKRTAQVFGIVFFVVIIAAIVLAMMAQHKGSGGRAPGAPGGGWSGGRGVPRAAPGAPSVSPGTVGGGAVAAPTAAVSAPTGRGSVPRGGGRVYGGGGPHVSMGLGVMIPLDDHRHTHNGTVADEDESFGGNDLYVSMTLVSAHDGRVLWHTRDNLDVDLDDPKDVDRFVRKITETIPAAR